MSAAARAFDRHASGYDEVAQSALGRHYRERVAVIVDRFLAPESRVLDIGCGTGIDAARLAEAGHRVTAVDGSPEMVARAGRRLGQAAEVLEHDIETLDRVDLGQPFDLILANFGVINCCRDLPRFGRWLDRAMTSTGVAVVVSMAPICPPELLQAVAGRNRTLRNRRRPDTGGRSTPESGYGDVPVRYLSARDLVEALNDGAEHGLILDHAVALGVVLPTFEQRRVVEDRPWLLAGLGRLDRLMAGPMAATKIGDHHVAVLSKGAGLSNEAGLSKEVGP